MTFYLISLKFKTFFFKLKHILYIGVNLVITIQKRVKHEKRLITAGLKHVCHN